MSPKVRQSYCCTCFWDLSLRPYSWCQEYDL